MRTRGAGLLILVWLVAGAAGQTGLTDRTAEQVRKLDGPVTIHTAMKGEFGTTLKGHAGSVYSLAFSPDSRTLASAGKDGTVRLWEVATGKQRAALRGHTRSVVVVAFSPGGLRLVSGGLDHSVRVWDASGKTLRVLRVGWDVNAVALSPNGRNLAVAGEDKGPAGGTLWLWDMEAGKCRLAAKRRLFSFTSVAFSRDGRTLAAGDEWGVLTLWEVATGKVRSSLFSRPEVLSFAFVAEGSLLAAGTFEGDIRVWDFRTGKEQPRLKGHTKRVRAVAASRSGRLLASASSDHTVRLWDMSSRKGALVVKQTLIVSTVAFSPDGRLLALGDKGGTIRLWSVPSLLARRGAE